MMGFLQLFQVRDFFVQGVSSLHQAVSICLTPVDYCTQESVVNYVRAGINLRAAWKAYELCYDEIKDVPTAELYKRYDYQTVGGIQLGIGAINVAISSLPTKIIRLVSIFGLPHDRNKGFDLLTKCVSGGKNERKRTNESMCDLR